MILELNATKLEELVVQAVSKAIDKKLRKPVHTIEEVCDMFGVTKRSLQYLRDTKKLGYIKEGKKILFRAEDLEAFFQAHYVKGGKS